MPDPVAPDPLWLMLWRENGDLAEACLGEPFVAGLASGATPREAFARYLAQDAWFLESFAKAYALGLAKSRERADLWRFKELLDGVVAELRLHAGYARDWGIDLTTVEPLPACQAYTDFLRATAALEPIPQLAAAMAPCMRLYAWLGQTLLPQTTADSPYRAWVTTYADPGFSALASEVEGLLERPGADPLAQRQLYRQAMQLELGFFRECSSP